MTEQTAGDVAAPPARRRGMRGTAGSMVISMIIVTAACLVWLAIVPRPSKVTHPVQDVAGIAREVGIQQHWTVSYPRNLGKDWSPVNVRLLRLDQQPPTWQAGYDGPKGTYAAVLQTNSGTASWVNAQTANGADKGSVTIGGAVWSKRESTDPQQRSLVRMTPLSGLVTVVTGPATFDQLASFAAALQPQPTS